MLLCGKGRLGLLPETHGFGGPKGHSIIALGNAQGMRLPCENEPCRGDLKPLNPTRGPWEHPRWHALSGLQLYKKYYAFNPGRMA